MSTSIKRQSQQLTILFCVSLILFFSSCQTKKGQSQFQNVILISLDDLRADRLGCYGNSRDVSPFIDSLARSGAYVSHAFTPYAFTPPSHISMMTSLYPTVYDMPLEKSIPTLASILSKKGISTLALTGGGHMSADYGALNGFEEFDDETYRLDIIRDRVASYLEENREKRFFLFLHTYEIHVPFKAPDDVFLKYANPSYNGPIQNNGPSTRAFMEGANKGTIVPTQSDIQRIFDIYDSQIPTVDDFIRNLTEKLESLDLSDRTLFIITSDHGEQFYEYGKFAHSSQQRRFADVSTHIPLIFYSPSLPETGRLDIMCELVDLAPTILEAMGMDSLDTFQGKSIFKILTGHKKVESWDTKKIFYADPPQTGIRDTHFKCVLNNSNGKVYLFDLINDPEEKQDISENTDYAQKISDYISQLNSFVEKNSLLRKQFNITQVSMISGLPSRPLSFDRYSEFLVTFDRPYFIYRENRSARSSRTDWGSDKKGILPLFEQKKWQCPVNTNLLQENGSVEFWIKIDKNLKWKQTLFTSEFVDGPDILSIRVYNIENSRYGLEVQRKQENIVHDVFNFTFLKNLDWNHIFLSWITDEIFFLLNGSLIARTGIDSGLLISQPQTKSILLSGDKCAIDDFRVSNSSRLEIKTADIEHELSSKALERLRALGYIK